MIAESGKRAGAILLADRDSDRRQTAERVLIGHGYGVIGVGDGAAALRIAQNGGARHPAPDIVLADAHLDGLDALRSGIRDRGLLIPLILLTSNPDGEMADDYLVRPYSDRELLARVETHLRMVRLCEEQKNALERHARQSEDLLNRIPVGLCLLDANLRLRAANRTAIDSFGELTVDPAGRPFAELAAEIWAQPYADELLRMVRHTLETGEPWAVRERAQIRLRHGDIEYYEWSVERLRLADGTRGVVCSFRNVGERQKAEQNANLLASIVESSEDAIVSKDLSGQILSWNRGAERVFGYRAEEAIGQSIGMLVPPDLLQEEPRIAERMRRGERVEHFETARVRKDGRRIDVSLTISPLRDSEGRVVGASMVARDVTARVRQELDLQRANADLQHFAWSASHDLQEPLRMVSIYSELLRRKFTGQLGSTGDEYIGYTVLGAKRMENLLRNLRTYTHVSTLAAAPADEVDAEAIFTRTLESLAAPIQANEAKIECGALPKIRIYEFQLEQIFLNLIANAIRYRTDAPPEIAVAAERRGGDWVFSVRDNGIGIDAKFHEQIFDVFKRLHGAAEYSGAGMGLAICRRAIERAGGRIWVESTPNRGSTFFFTVPAAA
jgi:PAS domain S-box-containing protein